MIDKVDDRVQLVPVVVQDQITLRRGTLPRASGDQQRDHVVLENGRKLKPSALPEKGVFIDYYI